MLKIKFSVRELNSFHLTVCDLDKYRLTGYFQFTVTRFPILYGKYFLKGVKEI
jgi:hypothetical protein